MTEASDPNKTEILRKLCELSTPDRNNRNVPSPIDEFAKLYKDSITEDTHPEEVIQIINFFEFRGGKIIADNINKTFSPFKEHLIKDPFIKSALKKYKEFPYSHQDEKIRKEALAEALLKNPNEQYLAIVFAEAENKGIRKNKHLKRLTDAMSQGTDEEALNKNKLPGKTMVSFAPSKQSEPKFFMEFSNPAGNPKD